MGKVQQIENQVSKLSPPELADFRAWYAEFDAGEWDRQIKRDVATGKLDQLAEEALQAHASGGSSGL
jgi:hypothetical protein